MKMLNSDEYGQRTLRKYRQLEKTFQDQQIYALNLLESEYSDIIFSFGKVQFIEEGDHVRVAFNYDVHESKGGYDVKEFEHELGEFLIELIANGLMNNNLIYTGGIDAETGNGNSSSINQ